MIKQLLDYQEKEKEKLALIFGVESGRAKRELDAANVALENAKRSILALENDAKVLAAAFESATKNLNELFDRISQYSKTSKQQTEDEAQSAISYVSALHSKVSGYESQLEEITKKITAKLSAFEEAKMQVVTAQKNITALRVHYDNQCKQIEPQITALNAELDKLGRTVDKTLLERYKKIRAHDKSGKPGDIAVSINNNRCGACLFELPLNLMHKIATDGFILCEECGKIIFKK